MSRPRVLDARAWRRLHLPGRPSKIGADGAVRRFVERLLPNHIFAEVAAKARARFGAKRAPSKSAVGRYWAATRGRRRRRTGPAKRKSKAEGGRHGTLCEAA